MRKVNVTLITGVLIRSITLPPFIMRAIEAIKIKLLADALAYEIKQLNKAISENSAYLQLQAMDALKEISKDPNSKTYFLNGDSPQPLPLMHIGDVVK